MYHPLQQEQLLRHLHRLGFQLNEGSRLTVSLLLQGVV